MPAQITGGPSSRRSQRPNPARASSGVGELSRPRDSITRGGRYRWLVPVALTAGGLYLTWRAGWTHTGTQPALFWSLWVAEATIWLSLARVAWETWTPTSDLPSTPTTDYSVVLAILVRYEPVEVIRACLLAADSVRHPHATVLIDSVGRHDVETFARDNDCDLRVEPILEREPIHVCLAGILADTTADLVAVVHAGSVARPGFIDELIGDFDDPTVWAAQGRQSIFGSAPGEFTSDATERDQFGRILQPGKNHHNAALWSGDGSLVRASAVRQLGGLSSATDCPVFHLSVTAASAGWRCSFHSRTATMALTTLDVGRFVSQRALWARGHLQLLRTRDNPMIARGLGWDQRLSFLGTLATYLSGPRRLVLVVVASITLFTGLVPVSANPVVLILAFGIWALLYLQASRSLAHTSGDPAAAGRQRWLLVGAYSAGFAELLIPRSWSHALIRRPPQGSSLVSDSRWEPLGHARALVALVVLLVSAVSARLLAALDLVELSPVPTELIAPLGLASAYLLGVMSFVLLTAVRPSRTQVRFRVRGTATIAGTLHSVLDMSEGGVAVVFSRPPAVGEAMLVTLGVPGLDGRLHPATVACEVRWVRPRPAAEAGGVLGNYTVGLEFTHMSATAQRRIMICCRVVLPAAEPPRRRPLPSTLPEATRVRTT